MMSYGGTFSTFSIIYLLIIIFMMGLSIYSLILFIKLSHRGIKALDIYIDKNNNKLEE